jgi:L-alanine-DL-glutamate epimerase-like enolase superfamily enzyme
LLEVEITTDTGHVGRGAAPTGTSVGEHEAFVLRDEDRSEYNGLSVHRAVSAVTRFSCHQRHSERAGRSSPHFARVVLISVETR